MSQTLREWKNYPNFWEVTINQTCFWLLHFKLHISFIVSSHKVPRIYNPSNSISICSWTDGFWWIGNTILALTYSLFVLGGIPTRTLRSVAEVVITWFYQPPTLRKYVGAQEVEWGWPEWRENSVVQTSTDRVIRESCVARTTSLQCTEQFN